MRRRWLALAAAVLCGGSNLAWGQARLLPPVPVDQPVVATPVRDDVKSAPISGDDLVIRLSEAKPGPPAPIERTARFGDPRPVAIEVRPVETQPPSPKLVEALAAKPAPVDRLPIVPDADEPASRSWGAWNAGGSVYVLRPFINNNTAFTTTTGIGAANTTVISDDFGWDWHVAPGAWLGWTSPCGVGFRSSFFHFDYDSQTLNRTLDAVAGLTTTITPPAGLSPQFGIPQRGFQSPGILLQNLQGLDVLTADSDLRIQTIDAEATYACDWGQASLLVAVGGRYLQTHQNYRASLVNIVDPATFELSTLEAGHNFYGGGPTLAGQATWRIGRSGLSVFGSARGSYLIGSSRFTAAFSEVISDPVNGNQNNLAISRAKSWTTLPILEVEGGLEYARNLGRARVFVRGAAVNFTYFDIGNASSRDGNLSLFGAQVSIGVDY